MKPEFKGTGLFFSILALSTAAILIKECSADPSLKAFARLAGGALLFWPVAYYWTPRAQFRFTTPESWLIFVNGFFLAAHFSCWFYSLEYTTVASATVFTCCSPIFSGVLSHFFLKERATWRLALAILVGVGGAALICLGDAQKSSVAAPNPFLGNMLALSGGAFGGVYIIIGRYMRRRHNLFPYMFILYLFTAAWLGGVAIYKGVSVLQFDAWNWFWIGLLILIPTLFGHPLLNRSLKYFSVYTINISTLGEPVIASILAYFLFRQEPNWGNYLGGGLILLATFLSIAEERRLGNIAVAPAD